MIKRAILFIKRFCYYGYHGAKFTRDYEADGWMYLVDAHIKRVSDFMHNPNLTHLQWNASPDTKDMKRLREFKELSRRISSDTYNGYNIDKLYADGHSVPITADWTTPQVRDKLLLQTRARKKDAISRKAWEDRYWYLLRYKVPEFWD